MKTMVLMILFLAVSAGYATAELDTIWERTYGGSAADGFRSAIPTSDGGIVAVGYTYSFGAGDVDVFVVRTDASGDTLWMRAFGGPSPDYGYGVCETGDGAYVVAGYTMSLGAGAEDVYLLKIDDAGNVLWTKTYGGAGLDEARSVCSTSDGCVIVAGQTYSLGAGSADVYVLKIDANGDTLWTRACGGERSDWAEGVCETADGCYGTSGTTGSFNTTRDAYMLKIDPSGALVWEQRYGSTAAYREDYATGVCALPDSGMASTGWRSDQDHGDPCQVGFLQVDGAGVQTMYRRYTAPYIEYGNSIARMTVDGYVVCGAVKDPTTHKNDLLLVRREESSAWGWSQVLGGAGSDRGCSIVGAGEGYFIVAGYTESSGNGRFDGWLRKLREPVTSVPSSEAVETGLRFEVPNPNPFRPMTTLRFSLPVDARVDLAVYDVAGRRVAVLASGTLEHGDHTS